MSTRAEAASVRWAEAAALLGHAGRAPIQLVTWLGPAWTGDAARAYRSWAEGLEQATRRLAGALSELAAVVTKRASPGWDLELRAVERSLRELSVVRVPGTPPARPPVVAPVPRNDVPRPRAPAEAQQHRRAEPKRGGGSVDRWVAEATRILLANGYRDEQIDAEDIKTIIKYESAGNPDAVNNSDSNARRGTPSTGLMQTIPPTFARWHLPGHDNIRDPVDNIIAAVRYAVARYGSVSQTPGIVSLGSGGRYRGY